MIEYTITHLMVRTLSALSSAFRLYHG